MEVGERKLLIAFAVTGVAMILVTFWLLATLFSQAQERLGAKDCPNIQSVAAPTTVSKRFQDRDVVCVYQFPSGEALPITQPEAEVGFLNVMGIYVVNFIPILAFGWLFPRDPAYRGDPPSRPRGFGFFRVLDPRADLVAGAILLGMGAEFLWFVLKHGSSNMSAFVGPFILGIFSILGAWKRLRLSESSKASPPRM